MELENEKTITLLPDKPLILLRFSADLNVDFLSPSQASCDTEIFTIKTGMPGISPWLQLSSSWPRANLELSWKSRSTSWFHNSIKPQRWVKAIDWLVELHQHSINIAQSVKADTFVWVQVHGHLEDLGGVLRLQRLVENIPKTDQRRWTGFLFRFLAKMNCSPGCKSVDHKIWSFLKTTWDTLRFQKRFPSFSNTDQQDYTLSSLFYPEKSL